MSEDKVGLFERL